MFDLTGRTALITGAGRGIGRGVARALAQAGALVAVNDLDPERADSAAAEVGGVSVPGDVTDAEAMRAIVDRLTNDHGSVDVLVNNAGIPADGFDFTRFVDTSRADWERFVNLNLFGVMTCTQAVLPGMIERRHGRLITISSEAGRLGAGVGVSLYGAAKAGAVGFNRSLSFEVARFGITANCLSLGLIDTNDDTTATEAGGADADDLGAKMIPVKRLGRPDDIGGAVTYLASDEASWVTGQNLPINGGLATT